MIDREKVVTVLRKRFPGAPADAVAAAANAIVGLGDEWDDVTALEPDLPTHLSRACSHHCYVASEARAAAEFRLLRRRPIEP
jgi:hypothetical protein